MSAGVGIIQTLSKNWIHGEKNMWTRIEKCFNNSLIGDSNRRRRLDAEICSEEPEEEINIRTLRLCQHLHLLQRQTQLQKWRKHSNLQIQNDQNHQIQLDQLDYHFDLVSLLIRHLCQLHLLHSAPVPPSLD